ncbi:bifunctional purine biosynthesis protein PurH, partial [Thalictrum thalictroides]
MQQNNKDVLVVVDPKDYSALLLLMIQQFQIGRDEFPPSFTVPLSLKISLRYGKNPHQKAAFYVDKSLSEIQASGIATAIQHLGKVSNFSIITRNPLPCDKRKRIVILDAL